MDRPLYTLEQYARYIGETVAIRLRTPVDGRRKFKGVLRAVENNTILVAVDNQDYSLSIEAIDKANIVPRF
jgi:ribosome maturation factor RimP